MTTKQLFVKPAPDVQVRDERSRDVLPEGGRFVEDSQYWRRRLADGDVLEVTPPTPADATSRKK